MRKRTWLITTLLLAAAAAGCSDSRRSAGRELAEQVDLARRLYGRAIPLLADPTYVDKVTGLSYPTAETVLLTDRSKYVGVVTQTKDGYEIKDRAGVVHKTPAGKVKAITAYEPPDNEIAMPSPPATGPAAVATKAASGREALELLDKARNLLVEAMETNPQASPAIKADAQLLLGEVELAAGQYYRVRAERTRSQADRMRRASARLLESARDSAGLGEFRRALADAPDQKIIQLRDQAGIEVRDLSTKVTATGDEIDKLRKEITKLAKESTQLRGKATDLRDRSVKATGQESYDLLTQAHTFERQIHANSSRVSAAQDRIGQLNEDLRFQESQLLAAKRRLQILNNRLQKMKTHSAEATGAMERALAESVKKLSQASTDAGDLVSLCKVLMTQEKLAVAAMDKAAGHLGQAESSIRAQREAAQKTLRKQQATSEILDGLADDKRLASTVALKASANLAAADVLGAQLSTAKSSASLADELASAAAKLSQPVPPVVAELKGYLADEGATKQRAVANYLAAEKDLEAILDKQLKTGIGKNIRWIYQARLAGAYYGHFRLTGDSAVLLKAQNFVNEALAGKEGSPYLVTVMNLRALLDKAEPVGQP